LEIKQGLLYWFIGNKHEDVMEVRSAVYALTL